MKKNNGNASVLDFYIDREQCIQWGGCVRDSPYVIIELTGDEYCNYRGKYDPLCPLPAFPVNMQY